MRRSRSPSRRAAIVHGFRGIDAANLTASAPRLRLTLDVAAAREHRALDHDGNPATARITADPVFAYAVTTEVVATPLGGADAARLDIGARFERLWLGRGTDEVRPSGATFALLAAKWWPTPYFALSLEGFLGRLDAAPIEHPDDHFTAGGFLRATVHWSARQHAAALAAHAASRSDGS